MTRIITVAELKEMSAEAIQALPYSVPIKDGELTVGVLTPVHGLTVEQMEEVFAEADAVAARRTPEEQAAVERLLAERGIE